MGFGNMAIKHKRIGFDAGTFSITGKIKMTFENVHTGEVRESEYDNLVTTVAKNMIASRLSGAGNDSNITFGAVGTGVTPPAIGDTTLDTELARTSLALTSATGSVVTTTAFFGTPDANGTLTEYALFGEAATSTADTGTMFNHVTISETKTNSETLTVQATITIG